MARKPSGVDGRTARRRQRLSPCISGSSTMADLFGSDAPVVESGHRPLARQVCGHELGRGDRPVAVLGPDAPLTVMLDSGSLGSLISGAAWRRKNDDRKRLLRMRTDLHFDQISAKFSACPSYAKSL